MKTLVSPGHLELPNNKIAVSSALNGFIVDSGPPFGLLPGRPVYHRSCAMGPWLGPKRWGCPRDLGPGALLSVFLFPYNCKIFITIFSWDMTPWWHDGRGVGEGTRQGITCISKCICFPLHLPLFFLPFLSAGKILFYFLFLSNQDFYILHPLCRFQCYNTFLFFLEV